MTRIKREIEELKIEMAQQPEGEEDTDWNCLLSSLHTTNATSLLSKRLQSVSSPTATTTAPSTTSSKYTLDFSATESTQIASLSQRLSQLESLLGPQPTTPSPILPTLSYLTSKLHLLTSPPTLDTLTAKLKSLTHDLDALEQKRDSARQRALLDDNDSDLEPPPAVPEREKVDALYAALATIDAVAPVLPGVVERLRGMRRVHGEAGAVAGGLAEVWGRLEGLEGDVKGWREAVGRVEGMLVEVSGQVGGTVERVEGVVKGLEERVERLGV